MDFNPTKHQIEKFLLKTKKIKNYEQLSSELLRDSRIIVLFRLEANMNRKHFAEILNKNIETIANIERGNKKIKTSKKCNEYVKKLQKNFSLHFNRNNILSNYQKLLVEQEENRATRARIFAHLGGKVTASRLNKKEKIKRARKAGLQAAKMNAGIHRHKDKWMLWSKIGLKQAGRKTATGPNKEVMSNELEAKTAEAISLANMKYKYEPQYNLDGHIFYPDFMVENNIIECCYWESPNRWKYLAYKLKLFHKAGFRCFVVTKARCEHLSKRLPQTVTVILEDDLKSSIPYLLNGCQPPR